MTVFDWIPSLTVTGLFSIALWLMRNIIRNRLTKSVQFEFDSKLAAVRSEFKASEQRLASQLQQRENELEALRAGALSGLAQRRALIDKRKLEAIDQLWAALVGNRKSRTVALSMSTLNLAEVAKRITAEEKLQTFIKTMGGGFDPRGEDLTGAQLARPYVSSMAWAIYSAITAITGYYVAHWTVLSHGMDSTKLVDDESISKLITAAAPEYKEFIEKNGLGGSYHLLEHLDQKLLVELNRMATDHSQDVASVGQAAEILSRSRELEEKTAAAG